MGVQGIAVAADLLASGAADQAVVVAVDHLDGATVDAACMLTGTNALRIGGGAGAIVIESRAHAKARVARIRSSLLDIALWGTSRENSTMGAQIALKECLGRVSSRLDGPSVTAVVDSCGDIEGPPSLVTGALPGLMAATPMIALAHLVDLLPRPKHSYWVLACVDRDGHAAAVSGSWVGSL